MLALQLTHAFAEGSHDPGRLPGLIALLRGGFHDLSAPLRSMRERVAAARLERERDFADHREGYDEELVALVEENLRAYRQVEETLALFESHPHDSALIDRLEEHAGALQASSEELVDLHLCGALLCPHCGMPSNTPLCVTCGIDCFYPDPEGAAGPPGRFQLPASYLTIFETITEMLRGKALVEELMEALDPLESELLKAETMVEQIVADQPEDLKADALEDLLDDCLEGIAQMRAMRETRQLSDLNEGWSLLVTSSVQLSKMLPNFALGTLA